MKTYKPAMLSLHKLTTAFMPLHLGRKAVSARADTAISASGSESGAASLVPATYASEPSGVSGSGISACHFLNCRSSDQLEFSESD